MPDLIPADVAEWARGRRDFYVAQGFDQDAERYAAILAIIDRVRALEAALSPSRETKGAYIGEFHFQVTFMDSSGEEHSHKIYVPWTTIKQIMAAILARAALKDPS